MALGKMRNFMELVLPKVTTDAEGFGETEYEVIARIRAAKEDRRDWRTNEETISGATFSTERTKIQFRRISGVTVTTGHALIYNGEHYRIVAVDNDSGRGLYVFVLAEKQVASVR
jgi:head-tail adaptor